MRPTQQQLKRLAVALAVLHATSISVGRNRSLAEVEPHTEGNANDIAADLGLILGHNARARPSSPELQTDYVTVSDCRLMFVDDVQLPSERTGIVESIVQEGDSVARGAVVVRLRDSVLRASLAIAEREAANDVEIRYATKAADLARLNFQRAAQANRSLAGTVAELELSELALAAEKAALQLEQAEHQRALAALRRDEMRQTLATLQTSAPFDAFVRSVFKKPGEFVQEGEVIAEVVHSANVRVEGYIRADQLRRVQPGQRVEVRLNDAATSAVHRDVSQLRFYGEVGFVDIKVEPVSQKIRVWADVKNTPPVLREGLRATMFIEDAEPSQNGEWLPDNSKKD